MADQNTPTASGYYYAKPKGRLLVPEWPHEWYVVEVVPYNAPDHLVVYSPGTAVSKNLSDFEWGSRIEEPKATCGKPLQLDDPDCPFFCTEPPGHDGDCATGLRVTVLGQYGPEFGGKVSLDQHIEDCHDPKAVAETYEAAKHEALLEKLSDVLHTIWSRWTEYMLDQLFDKDGKPYHIAIASSVPGKSRVVLYSHEVCDVGRCEKTPEHHGAHSENREKDAPPFHEHYPDRWRRQIATDYSDLSEPEQESDRKVAREILACLEDE